MAAVSVSMASELQDHVKAIRAIRDALDKEGLTSTSDLLTDALAALRDAADAIEGGWAR